MTFSKSHVARSILRFACVADGGFHVLVVIFLVMSCQCTPRAIPRAHVESPQESLKRSGKWMSNVRVRTG